MSDSSLLVESIVVVVSIVCYFFFFFFKEKTAYEVRIGDWSSDVCSSDLIAGRLHDVAASLSGAVERDRREAAEVQLAREAQERLAADRARQEAQERQQVRERERVAEKFNTIAGKREAGAHGYGDHNSDWKAT